MGITEFLHYIKDERRLSLHTIRAYQDDLEDFHNALVETFQTETNAATSAQIRWWLSSLLNKKLNVRSINRKSSALKSYFKFLEMKGFLDSNPMDKVITPKNPRKLAEFVPETSMQHLLGGIEFPIGFAGIRDKLILETFYSTGIRVSELVNLKHADIDLYSSQIKVLGKGNKERLIPVIPSLINSFRCYFEEKKKIGYTSNDGMVFITDKGKKVYPRLVCRLVNFYLSTTTSVNKKSPHVLRHTFATHMLNNGADINALKELLGHTSLAATQVYTHNTVEKIKSIYKLAHPKA